MMIQASVRNTLRYDKERCIGCGMCAIVCPHAVFAMEERLAYLVHADRCIECGACQLNCPSEAIAVDSGVGCAEAMIRAALTGREEATCGDDGPGSCCSGAAEPSVEEPVTCCEEAPPPTSCCEG